MLHMTIVEHWARGIMLIYHSYYLIGRLEAGYADIMSTIMLKNVKNLSHGVINDM